MEAIELGLVLSVYVLFGLVGSVMLGILCSMFLSTDKDYSSDTPDYS